MKKKILLLGDDIRVVSGVSRICKQLILSGIHKYDWVQVAAQKSNPDNGSVIDVSESVDSLMGIEGSYVRLYCTSGYGNQATVRQILAEERPDAVLHVTDPRYWGWLYRMGNEIRKRIPLCYYHVWDNEPVPLYNKTIYESCDWIGCISKVTHKCVAGASGVDNHSYVPHGVDVDTYYPLDDDLSIKCRQNLLESSCEFMLFVNNANMRRKQMLLTLEAFDKFCSKLKLNEAQSVVLLLHTNPTNNIGSNLNIAIDNLYPNRNIIFSTQVVPDETLNQMYNSADVTLNLASNEGFGLATLESLSAGTPIIVNKSGGLSEQIDDENTWGIGVNPKVRNLIGSPNVPYIYDDICSSDDVADAIYKIYKKTYEERCEMGLAGREFVMNSGYTNQDMCEGVYAGLDNAIDNHVPREAYRCLKVT